MPAIYHYAVSIRLIHPPRPRALLGDRVDVWMEKIDVGHAAQLKHCLGFDIRRVL